LDDLFPHTDNFLFLLFLITFLFLIIIQVIVLKGWGFFSGMSKDEGRIEG